MAGVQLRSTGFLVSELSPGVKKFCANTEYPASNIENLYLYNFRFKSKIKVTALHVSLG